MKNYTNLPVIIIPKTKEELEKVLTDKQKVFCYEYLIDFNATSAAKRAGYSEKTSYSIGQENLKKPEIEKYITILKNERSERTKIDLDWVINNIVEIINRCMQHRQVFDREGNAVLTQTPSGELAVAYTFNASGALSGLALLAQHVPGWKVEGEADKGEKIEIVLRNYLGDNTYFPVTPETEHIAKLLGIDSKKK
jgi:phage terminase small subunit